jgi:transposase-like protein
VHLLQVYSNPSPGVAAPQDLLFRSADQAREGEGYQLRRRTARQMRAFEIDDLVNRYLAARNIRQVAREFGISRTTAAKHLADRGVNTARGMNLAEKDEAVRLYLQGLSSARIGDQLGFDNHTILNAIRGADLNVRNPVAERTKIPDR